MTGPVCAILGELIGIYLFGTIAWDKAAWLLTGIGILALLIFFICMKQRIGFILLLFTVIGSVSFFFHTQEAMQDLYAYQDRYVSVTGTVTEIPYAKGELNYYIIKAEHLQYGDQKIKTQRRIRISSKQAFSWNDTVTAEGFLEPFADKMNESSFDSAAYYKARNIYYKMYAEHIRIAEEPVYGYSINWPVMYLKNKLCGVIDTRYSKEDAGVLKTVVTGNFRHMDEGLSERMVRSGVRRYLYSPHIHMLFLLGVFGLLKRKIPKKTASLLLGCIMILYAVFQSATPAFFKTFLCAGVGVLINRFTGTKNKMDYWAIAVFACGLVNPLLYTDPGFIMSSLGQFFFLLFYDGFDRRIQTWFLNRGIKIKKHKGIYLLTRTGAVSIVFLLGLLPAAAYFFNGYSLIGSVLGIAYIPIVVLLNVLLAVTAVLWFFFSPAALLTAVLEQGISNLVRILSALAYPAYLPLPKPSLLMLAVYYTALISVYFLLKKRKQAYITGAISIGMAVVLAAGMAAGQTAQVSFINVGQGDAALVTVPHKKHILIDAGGTLPFSEYNYGEAELLPYLQDKGVWELDCAVVSHYHADHAEGMVPVLENLRVKELFLPDCSPDDLIRKKLETAAAEHGTQITYIKESRQYNFGGESGMEFLCPEQGMRESDDANESSLVVRVWYGAFAALFTGDITAEGEAALLEEGKVKACDVLKVPHHGSDTSSSENFIERAAPKVAYIGVGEDNVYNLPSLSVIERYEERRISVLRADIAGTVIINASRSGIKNVKTYR